MNKVLLEVDDLSVVFGPARQSVQAVNGLSLTLRAGESLGLVGESGCGKSTTARAILRLVPIFSGSVKLGGQEIRSLRGAALRAFRRRAQLVFQDPFAALNPRLTVGAALEEPLWVHYRMSAAARRARVVELLRLVELEPAMARRYPHEFSGGQRQRICIARALALEPELLIADEPVSALDVSVQAQILALLKELTKQRRCALLLIAHDLAVVRCLCERVLIMYGGRFMESGPTAELFKRPAHPYSAALLAAMPDINKPGFAHGSSARAIRLKGDAYWAGASRPGCRLLARCPLARPLCAASTPLARQVAPERWSACHFAEELLARASRPELEFT